MSPAEVPLPALPTIALMLLCPLGAAADEMVIEDTPFDPADPDQNSATVTIVSVDEALSAGADVASAVSRTPGTVVRRLGGLGDFASISIRGSSARQVQIYLDGIPLNPDGSAAINLSELPLSAFQRIEVYRGNAPPAFGAAPIGGVVNLVTGTQPRPTIGSASYGQLGTMRLTGSTGQQGQLGTATSQLLLFAEGFSTRGDFTYFTDNNTPYNVFDDNRLERTNNDKSQLSAYGRWRLAPSGWQLSISDAFLAREEGLPGHSSAPTQAVRLQTLRNLATIQAEGAHRSGSWQARLWQQLRLEELDDRQSEVGIGSQWQGRQYITTGLLASASGSLRPRLIPALTVSARQDRFVLTDYLTDTTDAARVRYAASATASADGWLLQEQLKLSPVIQGHLLDSRLLGEASSEALLLAVTPRGGLLLRPSLLPGVALKANVGRYLRPPDFTELFGDQGSISGNPDLLPERGWQWDVGLRYAMPSERGAAELTGFSSTATDQIVLVQNSQRTSIPVNLSQTHTHGLEGGLQLELWQHVSSSSTVTWTHSENRSVQSDVSGKQLPRIPTWELHQSTALYRGDRVRVGHTFDYTDGNYWDAPNFFLAPPRSIHGAFLRVGTGRISAEASVLNLTDQTVTVVDRNPLSDQDDTPSIQAITDFIGYPLPGRTWLLTLQWSSPPAS